MKKFFLSTGFCLIISATAFGGDPYEFYTSFIVINNAYNRPATLLMEYKLVLMSADAAILDQDTAWSLYNNGRQIIKTDEELYFLSTENGYWIKNKNLRTPLKISGNYEVEYMEIQDIFRIDLETDYKIVTYDAETNSLLLERNNNRMAYPFINMRLVKNTGNDTDHYELNFLDRNKKAIRRLVYEAAYVDGYYCFNRVTVYNLLFNTQTHSRYVTLSIKEAQIPLSLFVETQMDKLIAYMDNLLME